MRRRRWVALTIPSNGEGREPARAVGPGGGGKGCGYAAEGTTRVKTWRSLKTTAHLPPS